MTIGKTFLATVSSSRLASWGLLASSALLASCGPGERTLTIDLVGRVGEAPFECGASYEGIGTTATTLEALDFRFYVHDVRVTTESGTEHVVQLVDDGAWQHGGVALIDFEDGCEGGNAPTNARLVGTIPEDAGPIASVSLRVGVPPERNHLDAATAPSPLNLTSMYWAWQAGYKYLRVDGRTTGQPDFRFHLGATGCAGEPPDGPFTCAEPHLDAIAIELDPDRELLVADLAGLFAGSDLDANAAGTPAGCMSDDGDPDCAPMFEAIGLVPGRPQTFFRSEPRPAE